MASCGINKLGTDSHLFPCFSHTPLQNVAYSEILSQLLNLYGFAFVCECGIFGNHKVIWDFAQLSDNFVCDPVTEIFLLGVAAQVVKRQYRNGRLVRQLKPWRWWDRTYI